MQKTGADTELDPDRSRMTGEKGREAGNTCMRIKKLSTLLLSSISIQKLLWLICYSVDLCAVVTMRAHACSCQQSLTVIRDQALAGSKQQVNFAASCLDQLNSPSVCDALGGLAVDLHYLISNLWCRYNPFLHVTSGGFFQNVLSKSKCIFCSFQCSFAVCSVRF